MEVSNIRSSLLTTSQMKALAAGLPSVQCGPRRDDEPFDQMWHKEKFDVKRLSTPSRLSLIPSLPGAVNRRRMNRRKRPHQVPSGGHLLLVTPVHPDEIDIQALANTENHFNFMELEGRKFVRVTCSIHSPDGRRRQCKWRVSDYNLEGHLILSVICTLTMDMEIYSSEERQLSDQEEIEQAEQEERGEPPEQGEDNLLEGARTFDI